MALDVLAAPQHRRPAGGKGFSLLEIVIAVCLLGVLSSVVVVGLSSVTAESASVACTTDAQTVETAVLAFKAENGSSAEITKSGLLAHADGGPYLTSWPGSPGHYEIGMDASGVVLVEPLGGPRSGAPADGVSQGSAGCRGVK